MKPKQFFFIFLGIVTSVTLAGLILFALKQQELSAQVSKLEQLFAANQAAREQLEDLQELRDQYEQVAPLSDRVDTILPDSKAQSEATAELAAIAANASLPFENLNFESTSGLPSAISQTDTASVSGVRVMRATFSTTGTYGQLQVLLQNIENNLRHMQVESINITREEGGQLKAAIIVDVYLKS